MAAKDKKRAESCTPLVSSFKVFCKFVEKDAKGRVDVSKVFSPACFNYWKKTRRVSPLQPEESFRRALTAHCRGSDGRQPFEPEVEQEILKILRKKERWPCFIEHDVSIGIYGFKAMGFHEKQNRLNQARARSNQEGASAVSSRIVSTRSGRRSPRSRKSREIAEEDESISAASSSSQKPRPKKRRSPVAGNVPVKREEDSTAYSSGARKSLEKRQSPVVLKDEFMKQESSAPKELKKKRSSAALQDRLKAEDSASVAKVKVDPMLLEESGGSMGLLSKGMNVNLAYPTGFDTFHEQSSGTYIQQRQKGAIRSASSRVSDQGTAKSGGYSLGYGGASSSSATGVVGDRSKSSWGDEHVPRLLSAENDLQNSASARTNRPVSRPANPETDMIEECEFTASILSEGWPSDSTSAANTTYNSSHDIWPMHVDAGHADSSGYIFREPAHHEDMELAFKDSLFEEIVTCLNQISAQQVLPFGYRTTCLKKVGLRRILQYAEDNFNVQWLNRATVALLKNFNRQDPRYNTDYLIPKFKQFIPNRMIGTALLDLNTYTYTETDGNAKLILRGDLSGKHDWTFRASRVETLLTMKLVYGTLPITGTIWLRIRGFTFENKGIVLLVNMSLTADQSQAVVSFQNISDKMQHVLQLPPE